MRFAQNAHVAHKRLLTGILGANQESHSLGNPATLPLGLSQRVYLCFQQVNTLELTTTAQLYVVCSQIATDSLVARHLATEAEKVVEN